MDETLSTSKTRPDTVPSWRERGSHVTKSMKAGEREGGGVQADGLYVRQPIAVSF